MKMNRMALLTAVVAFLPVGCTYGPDGRPMGMHMMGYGYGGIFMWLIWVFVIAAIVYLIVSQGKKRGGPEPESPLDILKKRYARGEITREEFETMKKDIES